MSSEWRSTIKIVPPNILKFQVSKDDVLNPKLDNEQIKGTACVEIFNKGDEPILFKIKTTNIQNYMVKPNAEIIPADHSLVIRVFT